MKTLINIWLVVIMTAVAAFANEPDQATKKVLKGYLVDLKNSDEAIRYEALKEVNNLKALYPNYKMKEFNKFFTSKTMANATKGWIESLSSDVSGLRHSTIHVLARIKSEFPQLDMSVFKSALEKVSKTDSEEHLQIDAKIVLIFLDNPEIASSISIGVEDVSSGEVCTKIHTEMDKTYIFQYTKS